MEAFKEKTWIFSPLGGRGLPLCTMFSYTWVDINIALRPGPDVVLLRLPVLLLPADDDLLLRGSQSPAGLAHGKRGGEKLQHLTNTGSLTGLKEIFLSTIKKCYYPAYKLSSICVPWRFWKSFLGFVLQSFHFLSCYCYCFCLFLSAIAKPPKGQSDSNQKQKQ